MPFATLRRFSLCLFCCVAAAFGQDSTPVPAPEMAPAIAPETAPSPSAEPSASPAAPAPTAPPKPRSAISIEIDLQQQKAYLLHDGRKVYESPISSGRAGHLTPTGDFEVIEKDLNHLSSLYGKIVERGSGRVAVAGADASMAVPRGCKFVQAPMKNFLRFDGAAGMHAGILPGYAASHGCVRMPAAKAKLFYNTAEIGSPVHVFGKTPTRVEPRPPSHAGHAVREKVPVAMPVAPPIPVRHRGWWLF